MWIPLFQRGLAERGGVALCMDSRFRGNDKTLSLREAERQSNLVLLVMQNDCFTTLAMTK